jgi:hypothetical protein
MKIEKIADIERVPLAIDYRRMYRGTAHIAIGDTPAAPCPIEFALELSPFGSQEISVSFLQQTDYPIVPAKKILQQHIAELDRSRALP